MVFYNNFNPIIATLGPFEIRWYGVMYVVAFVIAYFMILYLARQRKVKLTVEQLSDLIAYVIVGMILGARTFYVLFYNLSFYLTNPLEIFAVWHGGLSFHGALLGIILAGYLFCRRKKINFYDIADIAVIPAALGMSLGRIGNFINGELYGRITDVPWAVKFSGVDGFRHPSQLYESFYDLVIFLVLWAMKDRRLPKGTLFWSMIAMYGLFRFVAEFFRQPDAQLGFVYAGLSMGQLLSLPMFLVGAGALIYLLKKK